MPTLTPAHPRGTENYALSTFFSTLSFKYIILIMYMHMYMWVVSYCRLHHYINTRDNLSSHVSETLALLNIASTALNQHTEKDRLHASTDTYIQPRSINHSRRNYIENTLLQSNGTKAYIPFHGYTIRQIYLQKKVFYCKSHSYKWIKTIISTRGPRNM